MIIFAIGMLVLFRYASITELGYRLNEQNKLYEEVSNENKRISVDIARQVNLSDIRRIAEERLKMQEPQSYQIVHIEVPSIDETNVNEPKLPETFDKTPWYTKIITEIKLLLGLI
jgi:cell division protein FtsL